MIETDQHTPRQSTSSLSSDQDDELRDSLDGLDGLDEKEDALEPLVSSMQPMEIIDKPDGSGDLHRFFTPRQIHIISLGSSVGSGLFIASGKALGDGGPATMVLAYLIVCTGVWANLQGLGEMTIAFPTSGNYIDYIGRWVDPALAFGAGLANWLGGTAVFAAEAKFIVVLINFWAEGAIPEFILITFYLIVCLVSFMLPNTTFAWLQCFGSMAKIILFLFIIVISIALIGGAGSPPSAPYGTSWTDGSAFKNGLAGFTSCALLAVWAVGDQVVIGVMSGEASFPRRSMSHAATLVPLRVGVMYMTCIIFISVLIPANDPRLLGSSTSTSDSAAASPFVISVLNARLSLIPSIINICLIIGILAIGVEYIYLPSRILRTMAHQGLIPKFIDSCDDKGRPRWALGLTVAFGTCFSYMNVTSGGIEALNWFVSITSAATFTNWAMIALANFRFHQALVAQNDQLFTEIHAWRMKRWPLAPIWVLILSAMLLVCLLYAAINPLSTPGFTSYNFFQYTIGLFVIFGTSLLYKLILRTKWVNPATADLKLGRHKLTAKEIEFLDAYYRRSVWRRAAGYVSLW